MKNKNLKISHLPACHRLAAKSRQRRAKQLAGRSSLISHLESGQALITLLFFVLISLTITSAAIIIIIANSISANSFEQGTIAYFAAESGIENAMLRLLRDPNYTGETLTIGSETAVITVAGNNPKTVVSIGQSGNFRRTIQAEMNYSSGFYTIGNWKEI